MNRNTIPIFAFIFAIAFSTATNATICRAPAMEGFYDAADRAIGVIGHQTTRKRENIKIYIEEGENGFWYHSNYITKAPLGERYYPTKIGESNPLPQKLALWYILNDKHPPNQRIGAELARQLDELYKNNVEIFLDVSLFDKNGKPKIEIGSPKNITIVDARKGRTISRDVSTLETLKPPPSLIRKILGCCVYGIPPHSSLNFLSTLKNRPLNPKDIKVAALVRDSATINPIKNSKTLSKANAVKDISNFRSEKHVRELLKNAQGKTLILVSHVEGARYVIRDSKGEVQYEIAIDKIRKMAREFDVDLVDLGCSTAKQIKSDTFGIGVVQPFRTDVAIRKIETALNKSKNFAEFFEILTSDGMKVVLSEAKVDGSWAQQKADIFARIAGDKRYYKVAQLFISAKDRSSWIDKITEFLQWGN